MAGNATRERSENVAVASIPAQAVAPILTLDGEREMSRLTRLALMTAAGIAAGCAGNWARAEEHHLAAIARMEAVPYVSAQPIARYWYADMLAERGGLGDIEAAKALLQVSILASDAIGLALYARLARRKLEKIA